MTERKILMTYSKVQLATATVSGLVAVAMFGVSVYVMLSTAAFVPGVYGVGMAWLLNKLPTWLYGPLKVAISDE